jgi:hypothetical protein
MFAADPSISKNPVIEERRLGRFAYSNEFLLTAPPVALRNLFGRVIPVDVRYDYADQAFHVKAFSEFFAPVEEGSPIPEYQVVIRVAGTKKKLAYYVSFKQIESNPLSALFT